MKKQGFAVAAFLGASILALAPTARAIDNDRSSVGSDIVIAKGETAGNVACVACSIYVHGNVEGNLAAVMGSVTIDGTVHQRAAVVMGDLKVLPGGVVEGDTAVVMGKTEVDGGRLEGRTASIPAGPVLFVLAMPLLVVLAAIWFLVWVVRRSRRPKYPYPPPPPPIV